MNSYIEYIYIVFQWNTRSCFGKLISDSSHWSIESQKKTTSIFNVNCHSIAFLIMVNTSVSAESGVVSGFSSLDKDFRWWRAVLLKTVHPFGTWEEITIIKLNNKNNKFSDCVWWSHCMCFKMLVMNSTWNGFVTHFTFAIWCWMSSFTFRQTVRQAWISTWTIDWKWLFHKGMDQRQILLRTLLTKTCQKFKSISTYPNGNNAFF